MMHSPSLQGDRRRARPGMVNAVAMTAAALPSAGCLQPNSVLPPSGRDLQNGLANVKADLEAEFDAKLADMSHTLTQTISTEVGHARDVTTKAVTNHGITGTQLVIAFCCYLVASKSATWMMMCRKRRRFRR